MGLAAYGTPQFLDAFRKIVRADAGMKLRLNLDYFTHQTQGPEMTWRDAGTTPVLGRLYSEQLEKLLGPARRADEPLEQRHRDLAASMQARLEEVLLEHVAGIGRADEAEGVVPGRRRGVQLRREWQNAGADAV